MDNFEHVFVNVLPQKYFLALLQKDSSATTSEWLSDLIGQEKHNLVFFQQELRSDLPLSLDW